MMCCIHDLLGNVGMSVSTKEVCTMEQIIKLSELKDIVGLSRSSIYRMSSEGKFPKPIKLGERSSGWLQSEVEQWIEERIAISRNS